jgi:hypothetical protein
VATGRPSSIERGSTEVFVSGIARPDSAPRASSVKGYECPRSAWASTTTVCGATHCRSYLQPGEREDRPRAERPPGRASVLPDPTIQVFVNHAPRVSPADRVPGRMPNAINPVGHPIFGPVQSADPLTSPLAIVVGVRFWWTHEESSIGPGTPAANIVVAGSPDPVARHSARRILWLPRQGDRPAGPSHHAWRRR